MADSIFDKSDTTVLDDTLPPELQGKSDAEISAYYRRQNKVLTDRLQHRATPPVTPADDKIDVFGDATADVKKIVNRAVNDSQNRIIQAGAPAIIATCKLTLRDNHPDYPRFAKEVEARMSKMTVEAQMNPAYWDLTYSTVKGEQADTLVQEAVANAKKGPEKPTQPGEKPEEPRVLGDEEVRVAGLLGLDKEKYRAAADRYDKDEGRLPFTFDTRKSKKKA